MWKFNNARNSFVSPDGTRLVHAFDAYDECHRIMSESGLTDEQMEDDEVRSACLYVMLTMLPADSKIVVSLTPIT